MICPETVPHHHGWRACQAVCHRTHPHNAMNIVRKIKVQRAKLFMSFDQPLNWAHLIMKTDLLLSRAGHALSGNNVVLTCLHGSAGTPLLYLPDG